MRRKPVAIIAGILAWLMLCGTALAAVDVDEGSSSVYANGHAVTIKADEADPGKTVVTADDPTVTVNNGDRDISTYTVYGGWKDADNTGDTKVTMESGEVEAIYGGSEDGDIEGDTNVIIEGGTVGDVHGGGHATASNETETANVTGDTSIVVKDGAVTGDIYGGGDAESIAVLGTANAEADVNGSTNVKINGGEVEGSVYGGGEAESGAFLGTANADADVNGSTNVKINAGEVEGSVYGGGDAESGALFGTANADATVEGDTSVSVAKNSNVGNVYGGGDDGDVGGNTTVTINNSNVDGSVYGGSKNGDVAGNTNVAINNGSDVTGSVYGGGEGALLNPSDIGGDTNVILNNSAVEGNVYGGGRYSNIQGANGTNVTINNSTTGNAYGGSYVGSAAQTAITMKGNEAVVNAIFAGSRVAGEVCSSTIVIKGGTLRSGEVYGWGGDWYLTPVGSTVIKINQLAARGYTFYLPKCTNVNAAILRSGVLRWDGVQYVGNWCDLVNPQVPILPYQLSQPAPRTITVIFEYYYRGRLVHTEEREVTVEAGPDIPVSPTWNGGGIYTVGVVLPERINFGTRSPKIVEINVAKRHRDREDDEDDLPLGPGEQADPDLPLGVPSTGGASSADLLLIVLLFAGLALTAALRRIKAR